MKIAIIGTGIAGNVVAHRLHRAPRHHRLRSGRACRRTHAHASHRARRRSCSTSTPASSSSTDRTYPNFVALLDELGVASHESTMSFSVRNEGSGLEYNGTSLNALFAQRANLRAAGFLRMVRDILRFNREAPRAARRGGRRESRSATTSPSTATRGTSSTTTWCRWARRSGRTDPQRMLALPGALPGALHAQPRHAEGERPAASGGSSAAGRRAMSSGSSRRGGTASA